MASTTYNAQVCFRDATKTFAHLLHACNRLLSTLHTRAMVRNAGQLPQPFWLGATCGGGSCGFPASAARA